ncbi:MAG: fumarylacetoacetate hydrolase family protein [Rubrivivax sp.]|jgi:fumarylacetoacetase|nr:fumarylacetoacetate hydrolase family protein [Rubrivivax sp.]
MPSPVDATHDPALRSWVESANVAGTDFPIQNLPLGRFRRLRSDERWRFGVAIGDQVLDLRLAAELCPWADDVRPLLQPLAEGDLADLLGRGRRAWRQLRTALSAALVEGSDQGPFLELCLLPRTQAQMSLPLQPPAVTEIDASAHHVEAIARLLQPQAPPPASRGWLPHGRHARTATLGIGGSLRRPQVQFVRPGRAPEFGPSRGLDFGAGLAAWIGGGPASSSAPELQQAEDRLFGVVLVNAWSARDLQACEATPLAPFMSRGFATSVSPWIVTMDALAPFRRPLPAPQGESGFGPLDGDTQRERGAIDAVIEVRLQTAAMRTARLPAVPLTRLHTAAAGWSFAQMLAHLAATGGRPAAGELLASGVLSAPGEEGSLLEMTVGGRRPISLPDGERRRFLDDGDRVTLAGRCEAPDAVPIGFGEVTATVLPAPGG